MTTQNRKRRSRRVAIEQL